MNKLLLSLRNRKPNKTSLIRRFIAYAIDWYLGSVISSLPLIIIYLMLHPRAKRIPNQLSLFSFPINIFVGIICLAVAFGYYYLLPLLWHGQTLGKKLTRIKVVGYDGSEVTPMQLFVRQIIMMTLIEGSLFTSTTTIHQMLSSMINIKVVSMISRCGLFISIVTIILLAVTNSHQALHDFVANTMVVSASKE